MMIMLVGGPVHGAWLPYEVNHVVEYLLPDPHGTPTAADEEEEAHWPDAGTAVAMRMIAPGWRVQLTFYVDDTVYRDGAGRPRLERGLVMPGWVEGVRLDRCPLG